MKNHTRVKHLHFILIMITICAIAIFTIGCWDSSDDKDEPIVPDSYLLEIAPYKTTCVGVGVRLCHQTRSEDDPQWSYFYDSIEGFDDWEWGYEYTLEVTEEEISDPPADGSSIKTILVRVIEKKAADKSVSFSYIVRNSFESQVLFLEDGLAGTLMDGKEFVCESQEICDAIRNNEQNDYKLTLRFQNDNTAPLIAEDVVIMTD